MARGSFGAARLAAARPIGISAVPGGTVQTKIISTNQGDLVQIQICLETLVGTFIFLARVPYSKNLLISICACVTVPVDVYTVLI